MPEFVHPATTIIVGTDGTVWFEAMPRKGHWTGVRPGQKALELAGPAGGTLLEANERFLWFVRYDDDGVPGIIRYDRP